MGGGRGMGGRRVELLLARWVVGSIVHDGPVELFLFSVSAPRLV